MQKYVLLVISLLPMSLPFRTTLVVVLILYWYFAWQHVVVCISYIVLCILLNGLGLPCIISHHIFRFCVTGIRIWSRIQMGKVTAHSTLKKRTVRGFTWLFSHLTRNTARLSKRSSTAFVWRMFEGEFWNYHKNFIPNFIFLAKDSKLQK